MVSQPRVAETDFPQVRLRTLAWALLRLGAVAFGGLGGALALLDRNFVQERRWLSETDLSEALAFTKPLPGSTVVQVVAFVAWRLAGWRGAVVGACVFILPAAILMAVGAAGLAALPRADWVDGALTGLQVAVVGLLAAAMWRLARSEASGRKESVALIGAFFVGFVANAALIVLVAGLIGAATAPPPHDA